MKVLNKFYFAIILVLFLFNQPHAQTTQPYNPDVRVFPAGAYHQTENSIAINPNNPNNILICTNGRRETIF